MHVHLHCIQVKEWSTESLCFVLELTQIKHEFRIQSEQAADSNRLKVNIIEHKQKVASITGELDLGLVDELDASKQDVSMDNLDVDLGIEMESDTHDRSLPDIPALLDEGSSLIMEYPDGVSCKIYHQDGSKFCRISLPASVPKSQIVTMKDSFADQLYEMYLKYVMTDSDHEINISYDQRLKIAEVFQNRFNEDKSSTDDQAEKSMINIMDAACIEVLDLMVDSYYRFFKTRAAQVIDIPMSPDPARTCNNSYDIR